MFLVSRPYGHSVSFHICDYEKGTETNLKLYKYTQSDVMMYVVPYKGEIHLIRLLLYSLTDVRHFKIDDGRVVDVDYRYASDGSLKCLTCVLISSYKIGDDGVLHFTIVTGTKYYKMRLDDGHLSYKCITHNAPTAIMPYCIYDDSRRQFCKISYKDNDTVYVDWLDDNCCSVEKVDLEPVVPARRIKTVAISDGVMHVSSSSSAVHTFDSRTGRLLTSYSEEDLVQPPPAYIDIACVTEGVIMIRTHTDKWETILRYLHWSRGIAYTIEDQLAR